jgi:putative PIN family toxin of toxin-antitoxin system
MGKKKKASLKVVLDTNVIVSAILFKGKVSKLMELWKGGRIVPVVSPATYNELVHVLSYPKFSLSKVEIEMLLEQEVLPYISVVKETVTVNVCNDADDDKFLSCALSASARFLITGDKNLSMIGKYKSVKILSASDFLKKFR